MKPTLSNRLIGIVLPEGYKDAAEFSKNTGIGFGDAADFVRNLKDREPIREQTDALEPRNDGSHTPIRRADEEL